MGRSSSSSSSGSRRGKKKKRGANGSTAIMAPTFLFPLLLVGLLLSSSTALAAAKEEDLLQTGWKMSSDKCKGSNTLSECLDDDLEEGASSHRRVLYSLHYISYGALKRDTVPCSIRGASYYNCRPGAQAHPYRRGCSAIARCRIY